MPSTKEMRLVNPQLLLCASASWPDCGSLVLPSSVDACLPKVMAVSDCRRASPLCSEVIALFVYVHVVSMPQGPKWLQQPWKRTASRFYLLTDREPP